MLSVFPAVTDMVIWVQFLSPGTQCVRRKQEGPFDPTLDTRFHHSFVRSSTTSVHLFSLQMIFYVSSHTGILYDCTANRQCLLQGHVSREVEGEVEGGFNLYVSSPMYTTPSQSNPITCSAVSGDKRWLVTADIGTDCMLIVWDSYSA